MIKFLKHDMIDKNRWDECINMSFNGNIYAWSWYLDIIHPKWDALVENDYERVMPLTGKTKFGIHYLFQPFFAQQLGIFSRAPLSQNKVDDFINAIPKNYKLIEYRLNEFNKVDYDCESIAKHCNIELDLIYDYQHLYNNYSKNTKRNLAKAENAGLSVNRDILPSDIINLFRTNKGKDVKHWGDMEYGRLLDLIDTAIYHESCLLYGVRNIENEFVAGAVFMYSHDRITFLFSGSDNSNKHHHGLTLLLDNVIRDFSETQYTFDFEGSDNDGLARYYKGFGGKEVFYPEIKCSRFKGIFKFAYGTIRSRT